MLIQTKKGKAFSVIQEAQKIEGVKIVHSVMGTHDVVLYSEPKDLEELRRIRDAVSNINAVVRTETAVHT